VRWPVARAARREVAACRSQSEPKAISRIETGIRVVPDYELIYFSGVLDVPVCKLLEQDE
jgi:toxin-antitoxin system, antitoxin component, xre family